MRQRRAASSARAQDQSQASAQSAQAPALQSGPAAPVQGDQTPMLDAVDGALGAMAADDIADVLARSARGEDVPPDELTSAQLGVDSLDDDGIARVLDRLRAQGLLDAVVDEGVLADDHVDDLLDRTDAIVPIAILVTKGVSPSIVDRQIAFAERVFSRQGMQVSVVVRERLSDEVSAQILGREGEDSEMDYTLAPNRDDPHEAAEVRTPPGQEPEALLAEAWRLNGDATVSHVVFVGQFGGAGEGIDFDSDVYDTAHPGVIVREGANASTLAHELGHHLGLEHTEHEEGMDPNDTGNLMYFQSGARHDGFTAGQAATIRRSLRVQLVPRGTVDRSQPLYRDYPTENGLVERMDQ